MAKYKINWCENKTSAKGAEYKRASVVDESGKEYTDVAVFSSFGEFANVTPGNTVEGILKTSMYNGKESHSLETQKTFTSFQKKPDMKEIVEMKNGNIKDNMEIKNEAIKTSAAQRDAVLVVTTLAQYQQLNEADMWSKIIEWRGKFLNLSSQPF